MADKSFDPAPTARFSGLASIYAKSRPDYPMQAIDEIVSHCKLNKSSLLVDIGAGTGISSRLIAQRGIKVIAVEPNDDMRAQAEAEPIDEKAAEVRYKRGTAEDTGLADQSCDAVLCAQAFHWFEPKKALAEFHRILKKGGWTALMWNERDESCPFTRDYGDLLRTFAETKSVEVKRGIAGRALLQCDLFQATEPVVFANQQVVSEQGLIDRAFSASYAPKEAGEKERLTDSLRLLFQKYQSDSTVTIRYETSIYFGQRID